MKILKLTPQQSQELIALNNQSGKHLNPCDYGAGISVQADFDEATYPQQKTYIESHGLTPIEIMGSEEEKLTIISREIIKTGLANYPNLPSSGLLKAGSIYNYNGALVQVVQDHTRTIYPPNETPALFNYYQSATGNIDWIALEKVFIGDERIFNGKTYKCIQAHQTQDSWNPELTVGTLWQVVPTTEEWTVGVAYRVNDIVTYQGSTYKCLQAHTSISTWYPSVVPALWQLQ